MPTDVMRDSLDDFYADSWDWMEQGWFWGSPGMPRYLIGSYYDALGWEEERGNSIDGICYMVDYCRLESQYEVEGTLPLTQGYRHFIYPEIDERPADPWDGDYWWDDIGKVWGVASWIIDETNLHWRRPPKDAQKDILEQTDKKHRPQLALYGPEGWRYLFDIPEFFKVHLRADGFLEIFLDKPRDQYIRNSDSGVQAEDPRGLDGYEYLGEIEDVYTVEEGVFFDGTSPLVIQPRLVVRTTEYVDTEPSWVDTIQSAGGVGAVERGKRVNENANMRFSMEIGTHTPDVAVPEDIVCQTRIESHTLKGVPYKMNFANEIQRPGYGEGWLHPGSLEIIPELQGSLEVDRP